MFVGEVAVLEVVAVAVVVIWGTVVEEGCFPDLELLEGVEGQATVMSVVQKEQDVCADLSL